MDPISVKFKAFFKANEIAKQAIGNMVGTN
jgi:hypothetical protein